VRPRALPLTTALVVGRPPADDAIATSEASARAAAPGGPADSRGWFGLRSMAPARPLQQCCPAEGGCPVTPDAAVRPVSARLLLLCLLLRSSWLAAEGGLQVGAARVLHRRGGGTAVAESVGVAVSVPLQNSRAVGDATSGLLLLGDRSSARFGGRRRSSPPWDQHRRPARTTAWTRALARRLQAPHARLWRIRGLLHRVPRALRSCSHRHRR
jgi:hypothetical protein